MSIRKLHRIIGIILLLPFLGWAITGFIFFIKPGYAGAYETLAPKTYPLNASLTINAAPDWLEARYLKTVLGEHLLVRTEKGWQHLNPQTLQEKSAPTADEIRLLLNDAFAGNPQRYGNLTEIGEKTARTDTGVEITFDWNRLSLTQKGRDTERIDFFYKIHYLQWTGVEYIDKPLGFIGLALVLLLTFLGVMLVFKRS